MNAITNEYVNGLLADAAYVDLRAGDAGSTLEGKLQGRMTPALAGFIKNNFSVLNAVISGASVVGSGFDATIWKGLPDTDYAGQIYISMRGTQGFTDVISDIDLTFGGPAGNELVDMVNWWLRITTPSNQFATQIQIDAFSPISYFK